MNRLIVAVMLAACLALSGCSDDKNPPPPSRRGGPGGAQAAPTPPDNRGDVLFRLPALDGRSVAVRGPVALFFFTSWCGYCKQVMPECNRMAIQARDRGWRVYGINVSETPDKAEWFVQSYRPDFPVLLDQSGQVTSQHGVTGLPTFVLVNADGRMTYKAHELPRRF